ncbi:helix-turn-helix transcriptional regulator [Actinospica robiniae]|uniref:helix-turn-helix transcriptional regulator n=1 Tax=Actinospica robiniae TaxID=304901 RepID=UPI000550544A|nr:helix-turn-helix transcriptional regulator [Actinospica robiniae]
MGSAMQQRRELAEFLRSRRERRRPEDVGLPVGARRKTPGLRREEVATLAGLSVTWYTWLEQAREIRASRQVLGCLVDVLGLDAKETEHLYQLAGEAAPLGPPDLAAAAAPSHRILLDQLDPSPAYLVNRRFDILAWNRGCAALYPDLARLPPERRNVLWLTFTSPGMRTISMDWERDAEHAVGVFRAQLGQGVLDDSITALVGQLEDESEEFRRLWRSRAVAAYAPSRLAFNHPRLGPVEFEYVKMHTADDDKTLVAFLAAPGSELSRRLGALIAEGDDIAP